MSSDQKSILDDEDFRIMLLSLMTYVKAAKGAPRGSVYARSRSHAHAALMKLKRTTLGFNIGVFTGDDYNAIVRALTSFSEGLSVSPLRTKDQEYATLVDDYIVKASNALRKLRIIAEGQAGFNKG